jgi:virginiamycin B lyase
MLTACGIGGSTNSTGTSNATPTKKTLALSTGKISEFPISTANGEPTAITSGPDGNLWFTETIWLGPNINGEIGRITPAGKITVFSLPHSKGYSQGGGGYLYGIAFGPVAITSGPDGNLWFTDLPGKIGHISPDGKNITEFSFSSANSGEYGITSGFDGNLWFTDDSGKIGQIEFRHE